MTDIRIKVIQDINMIPKNDWNRLASDSMPFYDYGWFKTFHSTLGEPIYFLAYREGELIAILPASIVRDPNTYVFHNPKEVLICGNEVDLINLLLSHNIKYGKAIKNINRIGKLLSPIINRFVFPSLVFISPQGFTCDVVMEKSEGNKDVLFELLKFIEIYSKKMKIKTKSFMWAHSSNDFLLNVLEEFDYLKVLGEMDFSMDIGFASLDEYCSKLLSKRRNRVKKELALFDKAGLVVKYYDDPLFINSNLNKISILCHNHISKHNSSISFNEFRSYFDGLLLGMPSSIYLIAAESKIDSSIVGCMLGIKKNNILYPKYYGFDIKFRNSKFLYFNICYYAHICSSSKEKIKNIYYGAGAPTCKIERGCLISQVYSLFQCNNKLIRYCFKKHGDHLNKAKERSYGLVRGFYNVWKKVF